MLRINVIIEFIFVIFLLPPTWSFASEVVLKSGQKIEGKILEQTVKYIKIDSGVGVAVTYYVDEIDTIDGKKPQVAQTSAPKAVLAPQSAEDLLQVETKETSNSSQVSVNDTSVSIVDSVAQVVNFRSPEVDVYYFSQPLTQEQKDGFVAAGSSQYYDFGSIPDNPPVFQLKIYFKNGSETCSVDNLESYYSVFQKGKNLDFNTTYTYIIAHMFALSDKNSLSKIGIQKLSCSFDAGKDINILVKNQYSENESWAATSGQPLLFKWDINSTSQILTSSLKNGPMIIKLTSKDMAPLTDSFNLQGLMLIYYQTHGNWPQNINIEELKKTSNSMAETSRVDVDKYDFNFNTQDDGSLKYRFKLKTDSQWSESTLQKPIPK